LTDALYCRAFRLAGDLSAVDRQTPPVAIIMGSRSDWPTLRGAAEMLDALGVPYEAKVISAHRTPERMVASPRGRRRRGSRSSSRELAVRRTFRG
jgi:hypothetical protein